MDDSGFVPFRTEADSLLRRLVPSRGAVLQDGTFGLGTAGGGFVILDRNGMMRGYLDRASGLPVDGVLNVFVDRTGTVWLGLQSGICKVESPSPLSRFDASSGLSGAVNDIVRHKGILYLATIQGIYYLEPRIILFQADYPGFPGAPQTAAWCLLPIGDTSACGFNHGHLHDRRDRGLRHQAGPVRVLFSVRAPPFAPGRQPCVCRSHRRSGIDAPGRFRPVGR